MDRNRTGIRALLILAGAYRVSLLGRGAVAFVDETLYFKAAMALRALAAGDLRAAVYDLVTNNARPGAALLALVPTSLQTAAFAAGYPVTHPTSLLIPTACNVAVSLAVVWLLYRLCVLFTDGDTTVALMAAAVYAMLPSSNAYIRHLFPYDWALAVALCALWLTVSRPMTRRRALAIACLAGSVVVIYPGDYPLAAVLGVALVAACAPIALVAAGLAAPLLVTEALARWAGFSYFASARALSATITGGSFDEGWSFLPRYLLNVDGAGGLVLIAAALACAVVLATEAIRARRMRIVHWILAAAAAGWIGQALLASVARKMVLYGRLIHPWIAMLAIALAVALHAIRTPMAKRIIGLAAVGLSLVGFAVSAREYARVAYPRAVLHRFAIDAKSVPTERNLCEFLTTQVYDAPLPARTDGPPRRGDRLLLINMCQGDPVSGHAVSVPADATVLFDAPHFERYAAYQFEGYTPEQRDALAARDYRVAIYQLP